MDFLIARRAAAKRNAQPALQAHVQQSSTPATTSGDTQAPLFRHPPTVLENGSIQILAPRRAYEVQDLVPTATASLAGPLTVKMWNLIQAINTWVTSWNGKAPSLEEMASYLDPIGELFFLNTLKGIPVVWDHTLIDQHQIKGRMKFDLCTRGPLLIAIDPRDFHVQRGIRTYAGDIFGTYLHEACHAFLARQGCAAACGTDRCRMDRTDVHTCHGWAWFILAVNVQMAARRFFPSIDVRMGILGSILVEYQASGRIPGHQLWVAIIMRFSNVDVNDFLNEMTDTQEQALDNAYRTDTFFGHRGLRVGVARLIWIRAGLLPGLQIVNGEIMVTETRLSNKIARDEFLGHLSRDELLACVSYPPLGFRWVQPVISGNDFMDARQATSQPAQNILTLSKGRHATVDIKGKLKTFKV